jgi:hypothetical protein
MLTAIPEIKTAIQHIMPGTNPNFNIKQTKKTRKEIRKLNRTKYEYSLRPKWRLNSVYLFKT